MFKFSSIQSKYFWIAIILIGTIGIWLPFLLGANIHISEIPILLTTYYVSIYFSGCLDSVINKIKDMKNSSHEDMISRFLNSIGLILLSIALVVSTVLFNKNEYYYTAIIISTIGTIIALYLWWDNNTENQTFDQFVREETKDKHGKTW
jgi:uncharacterized membrane protein YiaA